MEIFGVGPLELVLVLVLALIILGPEDMVGTARKIGQWVYRVVRSPTWRSILETSQDLRNLPQKIVRDAGLEETIKEIKSTADEVKTDISATTRELSAEMQAATTEVNREMQTVVQDANAGMKEAGAETKAAMESAAAGLSGSENSIAPPLAQEEAAALVDAAALAEAAPAPEEKPQPKPYEIQLEAIATGLGGKAIQSTEPGENTVFRIVPAENTVSTSPPKEKQAKIPPKQAYVAGLETFAQALGAPTRSLQEAQKTTLEEQAAVETEPAPAPWALGIPVGLNLDNAGGMEVLLKNRMDEMMKSIEKLDGKIKPATGEGEAAASPQAEETVRLSTQAAPSENGTEPAAPPARVRRNAKRPQEAKTAPAAEAAEGEAPKPTPRKRAAKTAPSEAENAEGEAPKPAPRKRAAKKTPVSETADQDSASA